MSLSVKAHFYVSRLAAFHLFGRNKCAPMKHRNPGGLVLSPKLSPRDVERALDAFMRGDVQKGRALLGLGKLKNPGFTDWSELERDCIYSVTKSTLKIAQ